jgi:hypothetical protein
LNLVFTQARLDDVIRGLHAHQRVHLDAEGFFDAQRQIAYSEALPA